MEKGNLINGFVWFDWLLWKLSKISKQFSAIICDPSNSFWILLMFWFGSSSVEWYCERNLEFLHQFEYWNPAGSSTHNYFNSVKTRLSILGSVVMMSQESKLREFLLKIWDRKMKVQSSRQTRSDTDRKTLALIELLMEPKKYTDALWQ